MPVVRRLGTLLGPGAVVSIAYVDPGNFATNAQAGAVSGARLLWVVIAASLAAMLVQYTSARLGVVTGRSLPELSRERLSSPARWGLYLQAEVVVMATDLAEVLGGALALRMLCGLALPLGGAAVAVASMAGGWLRDRDRSSSYLAPALALATVLAAFVALASRVHVGLSQGAGLVPGFAGGGSLTLAAGIVGATVMPHAIYVHSGLATGAGDRHPPGDRARSIAPSSAIDTLRRHRWDVCLALGAAGVANILILLVAARARAGRGGGGGSATLEGLHASISGFGAVFGLVFVVALLASGLASTSVGNRAGEVVMAGYLGRRIHPVLRRAVTIAPSAVVLLLGVEPSTALVLSQVVLSLGIPCALGPLVIFSSRRDVMGEHACPPSITVLLWVVCAAITLLNVQVLWHAFS
jgi:manganese transport protein